MTARVLRSYLFVPGSRPERFAKALASGAHAVIIDLEDAVAPSEKVAARSAVAAWLPQDQPVLLRINAADTQWFDDDLKLGARAGIAGIVVPKTNMVEDLRRVRDAVGTSVPLLPLIESALGLHHALDIARESGVARLLFGSIDFQVDLGVRDDELLAYRAQLVLASRIAALPPPVDGVTVAIDDVEALRRDTDRARILGFGGKLCIHPRQVDTVNRAFLPTEAEIAWARRVVAADATAGGAAVAVDGKMVDRPVLLTAQRILAEAGS